MPTLGNLGIHCVLFAVSLKPELFEGLRFDFTKPLNQNFQLCHRYAALCSASDVLLFRYNHLRTAMPSLCYARR